MLKLLFNRFSKAVYAAEAAGVVLTLLWMREMRIDSPTAGEGVLFALYLLAYLFLRFCATKRWHPRERRFEGLELHFKKIMIPTSYILVTASAVGWLGGVYLHLLATLIFLGIMVYVNATLLYLWHRDPSQTPVNYYSCGKGV